MSDVNPRIAVIGCGQWGRNLVRNLEALGALAMVCDTSSRARELAGAMAPRTDIVSDPDRVFAANIDGVVIATPARSHFALAQAALRAGKDALVEKPLALTHKEGAELVRLAEKHHRVLMVGHVLEYHPGVRRLLELAHSGELGQVRYIGSSRLDRGKICRDKNVLWSLAPHDVAIILRLMGRLPSSVSACGGCYAQPDVTDVAMTQLQFEDGARAHIHVSWLHPCKEQKLIVIGSHKTATFDDVDKELVLFDQHPSIEGIRSIAPSSEGRSIRFCSKEPLRLECEAFVQAIRTRQPPISDGQSGLQVLEILQLAQQSLTNQGAPLPLRSKELSIVHGAQL